MSTFNQIRRVLYFTQRTMGDAQAAKRGRLVKRVVRRSATRSLFRLFR